jgi:serine phosphatase RsbU (regulator of sigma subunit)/anti-sigma regulatory factor (Ser/Thr protein kinase)/anti-anti-sigma regulatory factor
MSDAGQPRPGGGDDRNRRADANIGSADHVRAVFDQMPLAMVSVAGPDHVVSASNAAWRAFAGRSNAVGHPVHDLFPEAEGRRILGLCDQVFDSGAAAHPRGWRVEPGVDADGSAVPADSYVDYDLVPYFAADGTVAGIHITATDVTHRVTEQLRDQRGARATGERFGQALDVISTLQHALLPGELPALPRVDVAAGYLLADVDTSAGGDWYDAIPTDSGRVALVVGDVVGHGVAASAVMGQLRAVLASALHRNGDGPRALELLDQYAGTLPQARAATVAVALLDPGTGRLTYCTAGHPPPLVVPAEGDPWFLPPSGSAPLGAGVPFVSLEHRLDPGDLVVLYSDGLIERPGRTPAQSTLELAEVVGDAYRGRGSTAGVPGSPAERVSTRTLELLTRLTGHADDVTILAAQYAPALLDALAFDLPAVPSSIPTARHDLQEWLRHLRLGPADVAALRHAVGELATNVVEHAYRHTDRPGAGVLRLRGTLNDNGTITVSVGDDGRWSAPLETDRRGLGLGMARSLVDQLDITSSRTGTVATVTHRALRAARLMTSWPAATRPAPPLLDRFDVTVHDHTVVVRGAVDLDGAARLSYTLDRVARGGTRDVRVDLSSVTLLGSAAVRTLLEALVPRRVDGQPRVELVASPGSVAQHVLELTRLPYRSDDGDPPAHWL